MSAVRITVLSISIGRSTVTLLSLTTIDFVEVVFPFIAASGGPYIAK